MNYRQWKKNYKKRYGVNPPASIDKRKQRKTAARALNVLANTDFSEVINRAAESIASGLANIMRTFGSACDRAGTICRNAAENIQPLEIRGNIFSWDIRKYGTCHYAVYEKNALGFKLFFWQKAFIFVGHFRRYGETTAEILRALLDTEAEPLDYTKRTGNGREEIYRHELREIQEKLQGAGIKTRAVFWCTADKRRYREHYKGTCEKPDCKHCPFPPCTQAVEPERRGRE